MKTIGVLALQGDFAEHLNILNQIPGVSARPIKNPSELAHLSGLVIPGGESTVMGKMLAEENWRAEITKQNQRGMGIYGTCAGCILLAKQVDSPYSLKLIDITVKRNAYGRQTESFIAPLSSKIFPNLSGVFIRAPLITTINSPQVQILATHHNTPVLVAQHNILAGTFHPELTGDNNVHRHFIKKFCS